MFDKIKKALKGKDKYSGVGKIRQKKLDEMEESRKRRTGDEARYHEALDRAEGESTGEKIVREHKELMRKKKERNK